MARKTVAANGADHEAREPAERAPREIRYTSTDGLVLFARDYGDRLSPWLPLVCLAGLTRTSRDFHQLATWFANHPERPRRVVAFDYRGRGHSQWDKDPTHYNPLTEMSDIFDGMARLGIPRAVVVGTSRGGVIGMLMGVARPHSVAALVLNDVGPILDARGLARIKSYVGGTPTPDDWPDAARIQRRLHGGQFVAMTAEDWDAFARLTYRDDGGEPVRDYDPALAQTLQGIELDQPVPAMWEEFASLKGIPIMVLRGENSDLLSAETVDEMTARHPRIESMVITDQGHPPQLRPGEITDRMGEFIAAAEGPLPPTDAIVPRPEAGYDLDAPATAGGSVAG